MESKQIPFELPIGITIPDVLSHINDRCHVTGLFRETVDHWLSLFDDNTQRRIARFRVTQMVMTYTDYLMNQFPELQNAISHATLAMRIEETIVKSF